jgi:hypothetical protein
MYQITDPTVSNGKTYTTDSAHMGYVCFLIDRSGNFCLFFSPENRSSSGALTFTDTQTGDEVTLQNVEIHKVLAGGAAPRTPDDVAPAQ